MRHEGTAAGWQGNWVALEWYMTTNICRITMSILSVRVIRN
jgi:hypothetical protein